MKHARNVAIIMLIALAVVALPGGGDTAGLVGAVFSLLIAALLAYFAGRFYRDHQIDLYGLGDRRPRDPLSVARGDRRGPGRFRAAERHGGRHAGRDRGAGAVRRWPVPRLPQLATVLSTKLTGTDLATQRRTLPDQPGVYLFRNRAGRVIYVGKAISVRKRVASHFGVGGNAAMTAEVASIESVVVGSEAEALLAEQGFIKQYRPRFNIRLRDDKSYPFIAISLDEEFPRVYFTRERHRRDRAYFGPYSNAKRVRETLELLSRIFLIRSCTGAEPGRRSGSPCLDYHINRCAAPCVGYVSRDEYRRGIDRAIDFLGGRYGEIERELERRMSAAAAAQEFERAAVERNRLAAVRSLLERKRVANAAVGTLDAIAVALAGQDANAQVFQVRDGVLSDRQSFYLANEGERPQEEVIEEFLLQYYEHAAAVPALVVVEQPVAEIVAETLSARRGARVEVRAAERGEKRRILELAARNAALAIEEEQLKAARRRERRAEALDGLRVALSLPAVPMRIECFDISNLQGTHTVASMVVFEAGVPKRSDYRRFRIRTVTGSDDFASLAEVLGRRMAAWERQSDTSPHESGYDRSFAALPNVIVIDGGKGQLSAGLEPLAARGRRAWR